MEVVPELGRQAVQAVHQVAARLAENAILVLAKGTRSVESDKSECPAAWAHRNRSKLGQQRPDRDQSRGRRASRVDETKSRQEEVLSSKRDVGPRDLAAAVLLCLSQGDNVGEWRVGPDGRVLADGNFLDSGCGAFVQSGNDQSRISFSASVTSAKMFVMLDVVLKPRRSHSQSNDKIGILAFRARAS